MSKLITKNEFNPISQQSDSYRTTVHGPQPKYILSWLLILKVSNLITHYSILTTMNEQINNIKIQLLKTLTFSPNQGIEGIDEAAEAIYRMQQHHKPVSSERPTKIHIVTEDRVEAMQMLRAGSMAICLWDITQKIRAVRKYRLGNEPAEKLLEEAFDEILECLDNNNLDLNELLPN